MRTIQGWGALILGVLILLNVFNIVNVLAFALAMAAIVAAAFGLITSIQQRRLSVNSLLLGLFGVAVILNQETALQSISQLLGILVISIGVSTMIQHRRRRIPAEQMRFAVGGATLIAGVTMLMFPGLPFVLLRVVVSMGLIGYGLFRLNANVIPITSVTWNETIRRSMNPTLHQRDDVIDVDAEEVPPKK
jgi:uncharacterized membrane protein HdeD (DUF308 family)